MSEVSFSPIKRGAGSKYTAPRHVPLYTIFLVDRIQFIRQMAYAPDGLM
jgi:hypothetical protein